ncbi:MAG: hypothetical protein H0T89_02620 [Deltaproteobacteria bacterium]|nr:hypothetical protein [Deltaproteobacteria bacterium]MDQ3300339.1 hypothetical protein [Myxococcota bacterium]
MKRLIRGVVLSILVIAPIVFVACKQEEGERCQVDDDCDEPLVCAQATLTCADNDTSSALDAMPPLDAPDAPLAPDAPPDAPPDARIDAMPDSLPL